ncbi:HAE1 family hydrophobic/amphiphilic exporter-1 [Plasticicumulans lactativorans]|uniref:HAE1 family hydrophobic/amphiphilic exporter-1 n=1 Tax=Plasticicumulans lactativorans TaxID=1133106 RepID=A0A4R2L382_9GAMM|nr:efflux RND transporter permease subunit [Plasticicumulans lactativorans]TCO80954.1 HAE1 family hydrophobic/amphiphilic exporter-1 [Plasticicumulans lactativorans]
MNLGAWCIARPVATILACLLLVLAGAVAVSRLPISALPSYDTPTISVSALLPGASPDTMAATVATPLEKQFATISGISSISSSNTLGSTMITLEFEYGRDIDGAALDVQAAILRAQRALPEDMTSVPSYRKVNPADQSVLLLALDSPSISLAELNDFADNLVSPALSTLTGVAQVMVFGAKKFAVRVHPDPDLLYARGLTLADIENALRSANANTPIGNLEGPRQVLTLQANRQLPNAAAFGEVIVATRDGAPVRLRDIAQVLDSYEGVRIGSWVNGERAIVLGVQRQPGANAVAVVDAVRAALPRLAAQMPESVRLRPLNDRSASVRESIHDVQLTFLATVVLVVMVSFLFLRRVTATLIPALALPVSLVGVAPFMLGMGHSLDNISMLGLTLATGLVVDDAIVMLENIVRRMEHGEAPGRAALRGARELTFTILSISISLVAVFIPIFFMEGSIGLLFHEFAVVVGLAVLISALVSLTLIPMLCARYLPEPDPGHRPGALVRAFERGFDYLLGGYRAALAWSMRHHGVMLTLTAATFAGTVYLFMTIPKGFFPDEDTGQLAVTVEGPQDIAPQALIERLKHVDVLLRADPAVLTATSTYGGGNSGRIFVTLRARGERQAMPVVIERLRATLRNVVGVTCYVNATQNLRLGGRMTKSRYQYVLQAVSGDDLAAWADRLMQAMRTGGTFTDVNVDAAQLGLEAHVDIDRDKASRLGIAIGDIRDALYAAFGQRQISTIYTSADSYNVFLEFPNELRRDETALERLYLRGGDGRLVPLATIASVRRAVGPVQVNHEGQLPAVTVSFNLPPGVALGDATARLEQIKAEIQWPASIATRFAGDADAFQQAARGQPLLLFVALLVIYVVLGVLYESFVHPLTILAGLPSAAVGALATLMLFGQELTLIATIGLLMLIGIVKKNAIMMIDVALELRRSEARPPEQAIFEAALLRFRPIMMTTLAAMAGALPIAAGWGAAAELRQPLGLAVVGGLVVSQFVTLFITPTLYLYLQRFDDWLTRRARLGPLDDD